MSTHRVSQRWSLRSQAVATGGRHAAYKTSAAQDAVRCRKIPEGRGRAAANLGRGPNAQCCGRSAAESEMGPRRGRLGVG